MKQLKKKRKQQQLQRGKILATAAYTAVFLALSPGVVWADTPGQSFSSGVNTVTDNIVAAGTDGLSVSGPATSAAMANKSIMVSGGTFIRGAYAVSGGSITLDNVTITTAGNLNLGLYSYQSGSNITMTGGSITTAYKGIEAHVGIITLYNVAIVTTSILEAAISGYGTVNMTGGSISSQAYGVVAFDSKVLTLHNVDVWAKNTALYAAAGIINASVTGQSVYGGGALLFVSPAGTSAINLTAGGGSRLYGATSTGGGTANLTLNNATWTNPGAASTLTNLTLGGGSVLFTAPSSGVYKTLTISNTLAGSGSFYLNSNLSGAVADLITVSGSASGNHQLFVSNRGNAPLNLYQAVRVVNLTGAANTADFSGGSDVGAYRYALSKGANLSAAYRSGVADEDFYLYNTFAPSSPTQAAIAVNSGTSVLWYGEMNEIRKRMGELRLNPQSGGDTWARVYADRYNVSPGAAASYSQNLQGVELGTDRSRTYRGGRQYLGVIGGLGSAANNFESGGTGKSNSTYLGAYASWVQQDGSYLDIVGKFNWLNHNFTAPLLGGGSDSGNYDNQALGVSAEIGKRFERKNGYFLEPQLEVSALWSNKATYTTANGLAVETPATQSLQSRLGITAGRKTTLKNGATRQVYGKVSWVQEYLGSSQTRIDTASFDSSLKGSQLVAGIGFVEDTGKSQIYVDVEKSWGSAVSKAWGVNLGMRWKF